MKVSYGREQLHHQALDLSWEEHLTCPPHPFHVRLEVMLDKVHHDEGLVHAGSQDDLAQLDDIRVLRDEKGVDLSQRVDGKPLLLVLHFEPLQGDRFAGLFVPGSVHDAVRALFHAIQYLKLLDAPASLDGGAVRRRRGQIWTRFPLAGCSRCRHRRYGHPERCFRG